MGVYYIYPYFLYHKNTKFLHIKYVDKTYQMLYTVRAF